MPEPRLHAVIDAARRRRGVRALLRAASAGAVVGLALAIASVIIDRTIRPGWPLLPVILSLALGVPLLAGLLSFLRRRPDELAAAIEVERSERLSERLSSALFAERASARECPPEVASLVLLDGESHAAKVDVARAVPIGAPRSARVAAGLLVALLVTLGLLPELDLFGRDARREEVAREEKRVTEEEKKLVVRAGRLAELAEPHEISPETKRLLADLAAPRDLAKTRDPAEPTRRPLAELDQLKQRAEALRSREEMAGLDELIRTMQGIDTRMETPEGERARRALSEGSPERASEAMKELAKRLADAAGEMSAEERASHARDLEKLAAALGSLPELSKELVEALSKLEAGDLAGAAKDLGKNSADLERLARLLREKNLLDQIAKEIEFTQDELAQLPTEWKSGPPPEICPDCLKGTCQAKSGGT